MCAYSYIRVLPDGFILEAIVFTVCEHEYTNMHPPPPELSRLVTALNESQRLNGPQILLIKYFVIY